MGASKNTTDGGDSGVVPKGVNSANWWVTANWKGSTNGNLTDVGSNGGPSAYGTYDQTGNVNEWVNVSASNANAVGGSFKDDLRIIHKNFGRVQLPIATRSPDIGFRICSDDNYLGLPNFVTVASGGGSVSYDYMICKYTVTNCDYIKFLRSMSAFNEDASNNYINVIWNPYMGGANTSNGIGIDGGGTNFYGGIKKTGQGVLAPSGAQCGYWLREDLIVSGIPGESTSVSGGLHFKKKPVVFVNFIMAAKYCNWLHHGMPRPTNQSVWANCLNTGAYDLRGFSLTDSTTLPPAKNSGAKYWIPTLDEWNKAGFYKGGGTNTGYWLWATQTGTTNLTLAPTWVSCDEFGVGPVGSSYSCDIPSINCP